MILNSVLGVQRYSYSKYAAFGAVGAVGGRDCAAVERDEASAQVKTDAETNACGVAVIFTRTVESVKYVGQRLVVKAYTAVDDLYFGTFAYLVIVGLAESDLYVAPVGVCI